MIDLIATNDAGTLKMLDAGEEGEDAKAAQ